LAEDLPDPVVGPGAPRSGLRADCARCVGLCCVAPAFAASADFAIDKPAGRPCPHLGAAFGCTIHQDLRERGFPGCAVFDCFGAGQQVVQVTFAGAVTGRTPDWRADPELAGQLFDTFTVMRQLHELLWYLSTALTLPTGAQLSGEVALLLKETERLTQSSSETLLGLDLAAHHVRADELLRQVSTAVRGGVAAPRPGRHRRRRKAADRSGADLIGRDLRRLDLRGANLRGAYLIGADLDGVDLGLADLIGADLRGASVRGADLSQALFLTQMQVEAARGDATTRLPPELGRPAHWGRT